MQQLLGLKFCVYFNINTSLYIFIFQYIYILLSTEHKGDVSPAQTKPCPMFHCKQYASTIMSSET
jgi:hypothetical protein